MKLKNLNKERIFKAIILSLLIGNIILNVFTNNEMKKLRRHGLAVRVEAVQKMIDNNEL
ncbi:hypothetical protein NPD5_2594 [Clostridium sporogenes]|uniref:Uncharacterized protein n=1 Tax=Clostridium sporogenes TaxID=1509 RepID=A0A1L3NJT2_CLOSG|nr:hypothetical protein [Clostridium sporogenes]APH16406.1 hypothetical protein NPD5_2594 [Clostridium sporogenes]